MDTWILFNMRRRIAIKDEIRASRETIDDITEQINKLEEQREERFFHIDKLEDEYESLEILPRPKEVNHAI